MPKFETDVTEIVIFNANKDRNELVREMQANHASFIGTAEEVTSFLQGKSLGWQALRTACASTGLLKSRNSITEKLKPIVKRMPLTNRQF